MSQTLVKICGVRTPEIARTVELLGANLMGLILAPSRRRIPIEDAEEIVAAIERRTKIVGVFVNESADDMNDLAERLDLDFVQLSGDEPLDVQQQIQRPVIRALRFPVATSFDDAYRRAEHYVSGANPAYALLLDAYVPGVYGGSGVTADWTIATQLAERFPVLLAGGLSSENVAHAIEAVLPLGVDVSSGVETDGHKDPAKIAQFIAKVRAMDEKVCAAHDDASIRLVRAIG